MAHVGPRVSIVVPMYNIEDYVEECIHSLTDQSAAEMCEILLVDDGSTDRTRAIAERAVSFHRNVRLLCKENGGPGPGSARNAGLDAARGEYVLFCDGDDLLERQGVERLVTALDEYGVDLAIGGLATFPRPRTWIWSSYFELGRTRLVELEACPELIHNAAPGNKMFRRSTLIASGLRFAEGIHHQDTYVTVPAMLASEKLAIVGDVVELYRKRESGDSIMDGHFTRKKNYWDHLQVVEHLSGLLSGLPGTRREILERFLARSFQGFALRAPSALRRAELRDFFDRASLVVGHLRPEVLTEATHDAAHRAAYVTMREGRYSEYQELPSRSRRLVARRGRLYIDVSASDDMTADMVRVGKLRCEVVGLSVQDGVLLFELAQQIRRGPYPLEACNTGLLRLVNRKTGCRGVAECHPVDGQWDRASAALESSRLEPGHYTVRFAVVTRTGQASAAVRFSGSAVRCAVGQGLIAELRSDAEGMAELSLLREG